MASEEAAAFYVSVFKNSTITSVVHYGKATEQVAGMPAGSVMTVTFELDGQEFVALNGGPVFTFNEAVSFAVNCESQEEIDYYWSALSAGGDESAQQCGWLKDKYGVSWQVVPRVLVNILQSGDRELSEKTMAAVLQMRKIDISALPS